MHLTETRSARQQFCETPALRSPRWRTRSTVRPTTRTYGIERLAVTLPDEFIAVEVVRNEAEAELLCSLLRSAEIDCVPRLTNRGAGTGDGLGVAGEHEILVTKSDAEVAREILRVADD